MKIFISVMLIISVFFQQGCSKLKKEDFSSLADKQIVLQLNEQEKSFKYSAKEFSPQIKSKEDLNLLTKIMYKKIEQLKVENDLPMAANVMAAFQRQDLVRVEFLLYNYEKMKLLKKLEKE